MLLSWIILVTVTSASLAQTSSANDLAHNTAPQMPSDLTNSKNVLRKRLSKGRVIKIKQAKSSGRSFPSMANGNNTTPSLIYPDQSKARFLGGSTSVSLTTDILVEIPLPLCSHVGSICSTLNINVPFVFELPNEGRSSQRSLEDDHANLFEASEGLLNTFGINGKSCLLRLICEMAESKGLPYDGLLGKALELVFLLDYGMGTSERLYDYTSARMYGEHYGDCHLAYSECPFTLFSLLDPEKIINTVANNLP